MGIFGYTPFWITFYRVLGFTFRGERKLKNFPILGRVCQKTGGFWGIFVEVWALVFSEKFFFATLSLQFFKKPFWGFQHIFMGCEFFPLPIKIGGYIPLFLKGAGVPNRSPQVLQNNFFRIFLETLSFFAKLGGPQIEGRFFFSKSWAPPGGKKKKAPP